MKYKMKFFIVSLFLTSSAFAKTCLDTLDAYSEGMKKHRKVKEITEATKLSHDAQDFLCLKNSQLDKKYADAQERVKVLGILWQSRDLGDGLLFNDAPTDTLTAGHFRALKVMSAGINELYQDPTLGAGSFYQYMESTIKTSFGKEFDSYFEEKSLRTLFPKAFFTEILKCGSTDENKMKQLRFAAAVRGEAFTAMGHDFFGVAGQTTQYAYETLPGGGPLVGVEILKKVGSKAPESEKLSYVDPNSNKALRERTEKVFDQSLRTKNTYVKEAMAKAENVILFLFEYSGEGFHKNIQFPGKFLDDIFVPDQFVPSGGKNTIATYLGRMIGKKPIEAGALKSRLVAAKTQRGPRALHAHWQALLDLLGEMDPKACVQPSIVESAKSRAAAESDTTPGDRFINESVNSIMDLIDSSEAKEIKKEADILSKTKSNVQNYLFFNYKTIITQSKEKLNDAKAKLANKFIDADIFKGTHVFYTDLKDLLKSSEQSKINRVRRAFNSTGSEADARAMKFLKENGLKKPWNQLNTRQKQQVEERFKELEKDVIALLNA